MYNKKDSVEVYFICNNTEGESIIETFYDNQKNIHYWYINANLAYQMYQNNFKSLKLSKITKSLLIIAASRYLIYLLNNKKYHNRQEYNKIVDELKKVNKK